MVALVQQKYDGDNVRLASFLCWNYSWVLATSSTFPNWESTPQKALEMRYLSRPKCVDAIIAPVSITPFSSPLYFSRFAGVSHKDRCSCASEQGKNGFTPLPPSSPPLPLGPPYNAIAVVVIHTYIHELRAKSSAKSRRLWALTPDAKTRFC